MHKIDLTTTELQLRKYVAENLIVELLPRITGYQKDNLKEQFLFIPFLVF